MPDPTHPNTKPVNKEQVLELRRRQWSVTAIAAFFGVDRTTLYHHVSSTEMAEAKQVGVGRLREALYTRAMGGRIEKKNDDGTVTVQYLKSSDKLLEAALNRFDGPVKQVLEMNPDPDRPANLNHSITPETIKNVVAQLESEF